MNQPKKYTALASQHYILSELWHYNRSTIFFALAEIIAEIGKGFGTILIPSMIVAFLEQYTKGMITAAALPTAMAKLVTFFVGYSIWCMITGYLKRRNQFQYVKFRCSRMTERCYQKFMSLDYVQCEDEKVQQLLKKAGEAVSGNYRGVEGVLHCDVELLKEAGALILYASLISGVSAWLVVLLVTISLIQILSYKLANNYELKHRDAKAELTVIQDYIDRQAYTVENGKDVRLYQMKEWLSGHYRAANKKYQTLLAKEKACYFADDLFGLLLQLGRDVICYGYLIGQLMQGMSVARFVLYIGIVSGFSTYFSELTMKISQISACLKPVGQMQEFTELENIYHHGEGVRLEDEMAAVEVEFSHVSFSYPGTDYKILDDVSFHMKKGGKMALVGINGAGKSTIVKLLCGFYMPDEGHIYINGTDLATMDLDAWYRSLAAVFQDAFIYSFSIADNVSCSMGADYDEEKCGEALKDAGLWEKIQKLPQKEETFIGKEVREDGIHLSGGETQKLMLARALYKGCALLLLDEPTAALDAIAENEMYEKYNEMLMGKTALFISHRLASTRFCDHILFLENGKITEEGTHEELMNKGGGYAEMFLVQSKYYKEEGAQSHEEDMA